jgi:Fic family protein
MRTYEETHPWLKFEIDLRSASIPFWMSLGEIRSKCEHIAGVPLGKEIADQLYALYLTRGVQATTAIEGNTLTEGQVRKRIEGDLAISPSLAYQGREVDNIIKACNSVLSDLVINKTTEVSVDLIKGFNKTVLDGLPLDENVVAGEIRKTSVTVGPYRPPPAEDCLYLLERLCSSLKTELERTDLFDPISRSVLAAVWAHLYIAWIHPFGDGNGRTARLVEFMLLLEGGVPAPAAHLLSNHYNRTRSNYYLELDKASRSGGDIVPFFQYALQGFVDGLVEQLNEIRGYQHRIIWHDFVSNALNAVEERESAHVRTRQLELVLALSERAEEVPQAEISLLTPKIAKAYATKTRKTLSRDLNLLAELGLVEISRTGVRARSEMVRAFLPQKKQRGTDVSSASSART